MAINLIKGQKINLEKEDKSKLTNMCIGLNWGAIESKGFLGRAKVEDVDLDASCAVFDAGKQRLELVYFGNLNSANGAIVHSGDDLTGDVGGDDGLDNEIISVNLDRLNPQADQLVFVLNSYKGQDFAIIPFARIRIYEGTPSKVDSVLATFDIASDEKFAGHVSMVMGKLYKRNNEWKFATIGEPTTDRELEQTVQTVARKYL